MLFRRSSPGASKLVEEGFLQTEDLQFEKNKKEKRKKRKKKKKRKIRKSKKEDSETSSDQEYEQNVNSSSHASIWKKKSSSKTGFIGFEGIECSKLVPEKKGYLGFEKSNQFFGNDTHTQTQNEKKKEQDQDYVEWNAQFDEFPDSDSDWRNLETKENEKESVWKNAPSGFKYRVSNTRSQQIQNVEQNYLQSPSHSRASAIAPPNKSWSLWKNKKSTSLFDDDWPLVEKSGISFFSSKSAKYQAMPESRTTGKFSGLGLDNTPPETSLLSRLKNKAKKKIQKRGEVAIQKQGYRIPNSESDDSDESDEETKSLSSIKFLKDGKKEVVLKNEQSDDTDDSQDTDSSSSDESDSD